MPYEISRSRLRTGDLRHQVQILAPTIATNTVGESVPTWDRLIATVWASVEDLSGRELEAAQRRVSDVTSRITIRYRRGIREMYRITWGKRTFDIKAPLDTAGTRQWLELLCVEVK